MTDSSDVRPIGVSEWDLRLAPIVAEMRGRPLNVHKLMANNPELLLAWWNFRTHVVRGGRLQQRCRGQEQESAERKYLLAPTRRQSSFRPVDRAIAGIVIEQPHQSSP